MVKTHEEVSESLLARVDELVSLHTAASGTYQGPPLQRLIEQLDVLKVAARACERRRFSVSSSALHPWVGDAVGVSVMPVQVETERVPDQVGDGRWGW